MSVVSYYNAAISTPTVSYKYDPNYSRITSMTDGTGTTHYTYGSINPTPILGAGGIMTAEDALEFFLAGANAVAIGVANLIHPTAIARIGGDLAKALPLLGAASLRDLIGAAQRAQKEDG